MSFQVKISNAILVASIFFIFVFLGKIGNCNESFISMQDIRKKLKDPDSYGASESELLWFKQHKIPTIYECRIYSTESKVDDRFGYSSGAIVGRRIIKELKRYSDAEAKHSYAVVSDYANYGDIVVGEFKPTVALEIICGRATFVVNYCPKSHAVNISSAGVDADCLTERWSKVVLASPALRKIFE